MTGHEIEYHFDNDRDNIHLTDAQTGNELENSPITVNGTVEIPAKFLDVVSYEMQQEFNANGFSDRMLRLTRSLAQPDKYIRKK